MSVLLPPQIQTLPASLPVKEAVNIVAEDGIPIYTQELLSFGKARELANLYHWQFSQLLGVGRRPVFDQRNISRHYSENELAEDLDYARCH